MVGGATEQLPSRRNAKHVSAEPYKAGRMLRQNKLTTPHHLSSLISQRV